ncbi:hypothetical protein RB200_35845 [Streptomyces sp. PmtG]
MNPGHPSQSTGARTQRTDPHPVEQPDAAKPKPIRIRTQQEPNAIRLAPT